MSRRAKVSLGLALLVGIGTAFAAGAIVPSLLRDDITLVEVPGEGVDRPPTGLDEQPPDTTPETDGDDVAGRRDEVADDASDTDPDGPDDRDPDEAATAAPGFDPPAWIAVVRSLPTDGADAADAEAAAEDFRGAGYAEVDVLRSDGVDGLEPGYWVVHAGGMWAPDDQESAAAFCATATDRGDDCYPRLVDG